MPTAPHPVQLSGPAPSNVDVIAEALREAIASGRLPPGERLKETPLADQLGVSRGPIREAIHQLAREGLLTVIPNRGAFVPEPTAEDVVEVYAMRSALGSLALHKLMLGDRTAPIPELDRALDRFEKAVSRQRGARAADADLAYQSALVASAGLHRVSAQFDQLTWQVRIFISTMDTRYDDKLAQMLSEVRALHEAICAHDGVLAERLWREKFERWVRDFVDQIAGGFDRELWVALTAGPTLTGGSATEPS
jgi:DNA-binding GntR family transcriptional regulator